MERLLVTGYAHVFFLVFFSMYGKGINLVAIKKAFFRVLCRFEADFTRRRPNETFKSRFIGVHENIELERLYIDKKSQF